MMFIYIYVCVTGTLANKLYNTTHTYTHPIYVVYSMCILAAQNFVVDVFSFFLLDLFACERDTKLDWLLPINKSCKVYINMQRHRYKKERNRQKRNKNNKKIKKKTEEYKCLYVSC